VLGSDHVADGHGLLRPFHQHRPATVFEGGGHFPVAGRLRRYAVNRGLDGRRHFVGPAHQPGQAVRAVLGLHHQVESGIFGRGAAVGHHHHLGGPGEGGGDTDGALFGHQPLRRGDIEIAGPDDDVHRTHALRAVGQGGDGLRPTHGIYLVHPGYSGGRQYGRRHSGVRPRRGAHRHFFHTRHQRRDCGHEHAGSERGAAAGSVAAHPPDR
jgi:hypothetical protein